MVHNTRPATFFIPPQGQLKPVVGSNNNIRALSKDVSGTIHTQNTPQLKENIQNHQFSNSHLEKSTVISQQGSDILFSGRNEVEARRKSHSNIAQTNSRIINQMLGSYNKQISEFANRGDVDSAYRVFNSLPEVGIRPNLITFNALIKACVMADKMTKAFEVLHLMQEFNVKPNAVPFTALMLPYVKKKDVKAAFELLNLMKEFSVEPDEQLANALIKVCKEANDTEALVRAEDLKKSLPAPNPLKRKYSHGKDSFWQEASLAISKRNKDQDTNASESVVEMDPLKNTSENNSHLLPNDEGVELDDCNQNIIAAGNARNLDRAFEIFNRLPEAGLQPNINTFKALIKACILVKKLDKALSLLDLMKEKDMVPKLQSFNTLIEFCIKSDNRGEAINLLTRMKELKIKPNVRTYNTLIKGHESVDELYHVMHQMQKTMVKPDVATFNIAIDKCIKAGNAAKAFDTYKLMKEFNIAPNFFIFNSLINEYIRTNELDRAFDVLILMQEEHIEPGQTIFASLFKACVVSANLDKALKIIDLMKMHHIEPDEVIYAMLIDIYVANNDLANARQLYQEIISDKVSRLNGEDVIDCTKLLFGAAIIQLHHYLDRKKDTQAFCILTGDGLDLSIPRESTLIERIKRYIVKELPNLTIRETGDFGRYKVQIRR